MSSESAGHGGSCGVLVTTLEFVPSFWGPLQAVIASHERSDMLTHRVADLVEEVERKRIRVIELEPMAEEIKAIEASPIRRVIYRQLRKKGR